MSATILGLLGKNISYSFSKIFFENKFKELGLKELTYEVFDIPDSKNIPAILRSENLLGFNVTQPYKVEIRSFLDDLDAEAKKIGAVNTVLIKNKRSIGYNTDAYGFEQSLLLLKQDHHHKALILGNGGAAKAIQFVLHKMGVTYQSVARNLPLNFDNLSDEIVKSHTIIIQCTPVGTFPNIAKHLNFPFSALSEDHIVIDLIYNPAETAFMKKSAEFGAKTMNGLYMLEQQAEKSWEIWNS